MDIKDLRFDSGLGANNSDANIKYPRGGKMSQTEESKVHCTNVELLTLEKGESMQGARPCAIIGPDRVLPPTTSVGYSKSGPDDLWPCSESYRQFYDHPIKMSDYQPSRNISPRQTFQENMQRIMVPPMYSSNKNSDESSLKNTKLNMPPEAKYCDVPFTLSNEPKTVRNVDVPMSNISPAFTRNIPPNGWQPGVNVRPLRSYPAPEFYQYPEYPSCAGVRSMPMIRSQRGVHEESAQSYSERLYQESNIRFKPYPSTKDRYPQARYEYISNCPTSFHHPAPYQPHKFDIHKSMQGHPYPVYPQVPLKYLDRRMPEPIMDGFQRPPNPQGNMNTFRNHMIPPPYGPIPGNCYQNKAYPYQSDSAKSVPLNKLPYDTNNKVYLEFENSRNKVYPTPENFYYNDHSQLLRGDVVLPGHSVLNARSQHPMYRKDNTLLKNYEYASHYRNMEHSMNISNSLSRLPLQFSPNSIAISPCDSNTSNETVQTLGTSQEDCGYVSQSSTTSLKSLDSCLANDVYKRYDYMQFHHTHKSEINLKVNTNSSDKKGLNVRQFLQMWNEGDEEVSNNKEVQNKGSNFSSKYENANNQEQLYVLGLVNVPSEDLSKYDHLQKISKLPENIKGYNSVELLHQYEQLVESPTMNFQVKSATANEFQVSSKNTGGKLPKEVLTRPLSPLDVESKISQSVIHKEVGCNFEIKPCSPKLLNVDAATPVHDILGERLIEKVTNTGLMGLANDRKMNNSVASIQPTCNLSSKQFSIDSIKTNNYNLQDMDTNSSVCLASLPQLDNDIDLNFPEVNQQFINANKTESSLSTPLKNLSHINLDTKINFHQNHELSAQCVPNIGAEKESTKLSKYRKVKKLDVPAKESVSLYNRLSPMQQRTDSVIIKNPENVKTHECENPLATTRYSVNHAADAEKSCHGPDPTSNRKSIKFTDSSSAEMAIDFSLNKNDVNVSDNDFNIQNSTDFTSPLSKSEQNSYGDVNKVNDSVKLNSHEDNSQSGINQNLNKSNKNDLVLDLFKGSEDCSKDCHSDDILTDDNDGQIDAHKVSSFNDKIEKNIENMSPKNSTDQEKISIVNCSNEPFSVTDCNDQNVSCETNHNCNRLNSKVDIATKEIEQENTMLLNVGHYDVSERNLMITKDSPSKDANSFVCDDTYNAQTEANLLKGDDENVKDHIFIEHRKINNNNNLNHSKNILEINITNESLDINTGTLFDVQNIDTLNTEAAEKLTDAENEFADIYSHLDVSENNPHHINSANVSLAENNNVEPSQITPEACLSNQSVILNSYDKKPDDKCLDETCDVVFSDIKSISQKTLDSTANNEIVSLDIDSIENDESRSTKKISERNFRIDSASNLFYETMGENAPKECYVTDFKNMMDIASENTEIETNKNNETNLSEIILGENYEDNSSKICTEAMLRVLSENLESKTEEKSLNEAHSLQGIQTLKIIFEKRETEKDKGNSVNSKNLFLQHNENRSSILNLDMHNEAQSGYCKTSDTKRDEMYSSETKRIEIKNVTGEFNQKYESEISNILLDKIDVHGIVSENICHNIDNRIELDKNYNTEEDTLKLILPDDNKDRMRSINVLEIDADPKIVSYNVDYALNAKDIKFCKDKYCKSICSKTSESFRSTKRYSSKEYYSPWMQKLYLFTEGICTSVKKSIFLDEKKAFSKHIDCLKTEDDLDEQKEDMKTSNNFINNKDKKENQTSRLMYQEVKCKLSDNVGNIYKKGKFDFHQSSASDVKVEQSDKGSVLCFNNKYASSCFSQETVEKEDEQESTNAMEKYKLSLTFSDHASKLQRRALKRSLSESALEAYSKNDTTELALVKKPKIITNDICNILQSHRRNSISEIYNEDNYFILIDDNNFILTDGSESSKICYTEVVSVDSDSEINNVCNEGTIHMMSESELTYCSQSYESPSMITSATIDDIEEKAFDVTWVEDVACVETIYSDDIAEDIEISTPVSPRSEMLSNCVHDNVEPSHGDEVNDHMEKVKDIYGKNMCNDDALIVETLFRTPQMNVNKTLVNNKESHNTEEIKTREVSFDTVQDRDTVSDLELPTFLPGESVLPRKENDSTIVEDKENIKVKNCLQTKMSSECRSKIDASNMACNRSLHELGDYAVHSCASSNDVIESSSHNNRSPKYSVSSSPEVTSTTSEEKNSDILLKISSYDKPRISAMNEVDSVPRNKKLSYKLTENMRYKCFNSNSPGVLITKAAQKYIPPLKETITDLKVKLILPQHSLIKLKELKKSKVEPKIDKKLPKINNIRKEVTKKQKPKFEDVLMNIDKVQYKMHKEKARKVNEEIPKVVIKKTESGAHYASSSCSNSDHKIFNPDLTGRKWQPWVFLEKNNFIDKMAVKNKQKAVYCHRKNSYVLSEKFRKYKSIYNAKFIISQPLSDDSTKGNLKYTIRLKHL